MSDKDVQREVLPVPDQRYQGLVTHDAKDPASSLPPITPLRPPAGAPNVLLIMLDDTGLGASGAFGGGLAVPSTASRWTACEPWLRLDHGT